MAEPLVEFKILSFFDTIFKSMTFPSLQHLVCLKKSGDLDVVSLGCLVNTVPAGLILATIDRICGQAVILSLFVNKDFRKMGLGRKLVEKLCELIKSDMKIENVLQPDCCSLSCVYQTNRDYSAALNRIFDSAGFSMPETRCLIFRCGPGIKDMPWIKRYAFEPSGFKIIPWSEIKDNSFLLIRNHVLESPDFPVELDPFRELDLIEKKTSLVLFTKEGDLAGWSLAHRIKKDTVRYSGIYVKKEYQGAGIAVILLMNSISRQVLTQMLDFVPYGIFAVYKRTPMMLKMCRKRFTPYADSVSESVSRFKTINCRP